MRIALCSALFLALLGPDVSAKYKGGTVGDPGTISGVVTLTAMPKVPELAITKQKAVCENAKKSPRLVADEATKGLGNVVVYIDGIERGKPKAKGHFVIDQKNCQYAPHISIVPTRSTLAFSSSDPIPHNVHVFKGTPDAPHTKSQDVLNQAMKDDRVPEAGMGRPALRRPAFYYVQCDAGHFWMSAYIWVVEHPYYVITDSKGRFELKDVPPGRYTLRFWHENWKAEPVVTDGEVVGYTYGAPLQHSVTVEVKGGQVTAADWKVPVQG